MDEVEKAQQDFKKGGSKLKIVIIVLIILVLALGAAAGVYFFMNTPKKAFDKGMETVSKFMKEDLLGSLTATKFVYDRNKVLETNVALSGEVNLDGTEYDEQVNEINDLIKDVKVDLKNKLDLNNENIWLYLGLQENNETVISGEAFLNRDILIGKLQEIAGNYLYAKTEDMPEEISAGINSFFDSITMTEGNAQYEEIAKEYKEVVLNSIPDEQYKKESTSITVNGSSVKTQKTSLMLGETEIKAILKNVFTKFKTDDRTLDLIISTMEKSDSYSYYTPEEIKEELVQGIDKILPQIDSTELGISIEINTYIKGKELVQFEVKAAVEIEGQNVTASMVMTCVDKSNINTVFEVNIGGVSYEVRLDIVKSEDKTTATLDFGSLVGLKVVYESTRVSAEREEIKLDVMQSNMSIATLECNTDYYKNTEEELQTKQDIILDVANPMGSEEIGAKITTETHMFYIDSVDVPTPNNNDIDLINGEMPGEYIERLQNKMNEMQLVKYIQGLMSGGNSISNPTVDGDSLFD